jgi:hypothetical protein
MCGQPWATTRGAGSCGHWPGTHVLCPSGLDIRRSARPATRALISTDSHDKIRVFVDPVYYQETVASCSRLVRSIGDIGPRSYLPCSTGSLNRPLGCKSRLIEYYIAGCVVVGTVRKAPLAQARWILSIRPFPREQAPVVQKVGTACARKITPRARETAKSEAAFRGLVVSPHLFSVTSQHNIPIRVSTAAATHIYSISDRGRRDGGLLYLRPREARRRSSSTPGLSSKSTVAVSNATGTSPCPSAHCSAVGRFSRPSL